MFACLFDLILYVPSTIFQLNRDRSFWVEPVLGKDKCVLLKDHNAVTLVRPSKERVNQYVTMFFRVIMLELLSDKQNLVFVRVYSVINMWYMFFWVITLKSLSDKQNLVFVREYFQYPV